MLTNRRVLVTGGAGFIGTHLCTRLLARDDEVLCVDNFYTGTRHNVQHLLSDSLLDSMLRTAIEHRDRVREDVILPRVDWRATHNRLRRRHES